MNVYLKGLYGLVLQSKSEKNRLLEKRQRTLLAIELSHACTPTWNFQPLKCTPLLMICDQGYFGFINLVENVNWSSYRV